MPDSNTMKTVAVETNSISGSNAAEHSPAG